MSQESPTSGMLAQACAVLEQRGRPLNARKIAGYAGLPTDAGTVSAMRTTLGAAAGEGVVVEVRKGVFALQAAGASPAVAPTPPQKVEAPSTPSAALAMSPPCSLRRVEDTGRRRNTIKISEWVGPNPLAPLTVEAATAASLGAATLEAGRREGWATLVSRAAQTIGLSVPETPSVMAPDGPAAEPVAEPILLEGDTTERILAALLAEGAPMALPDLATSVGLGVDTEALCAAIEMSNGEDLRGALVERVWFENGLAGLTVWTMSAALMEAEAKIEVALAERSALVYASLLAQTNSMADEAFETLVAALLNEMGYEDLLCVHRQPGGAVAFTGLLTGGEAVVVASRAKEVGANTIKALSESLDQLDAEGGLLLCTGAVHVEGRYRDDPRLTLVDGSAFAALLDTHGVGFIERTPAIRYLDPMFFEWLG